MEPSKELVIIGSVDSGWVTYVISCGGGTMVEGFTSAGGYSLVPERPH
jgi:hypothetical protein